MASINPKKDWCYVKNVDGIQHIFMPDGKRFPAVMMTRVTDDYTNMANGGKVTTALVKLRVILK